MTRVRRAGALAAVVLLLSGCASWGLTQREWAATLEASDGVVSADWRYQNNWPSSSPRYDATIVVERGVTVDEARRIADASCATETRIDGLTIRTDDAPASEGTDDASGSEGSDEAPAEGSVELRTERSCASRADLERFAGAVDALNRLPDATGVRFSVDRTARHDGAGAKQLTVRVTAPDEEALGSILPALHEAAGDDGLALTAERIGAQGGAGTTVEAILPPGARMDDLMSLFALATRIDHRRISLTDASISVSASSTAAAETDAAAELAAAGARLGIDTRVAFDTAGASGEAGGSDAAGGSSASGADAEAARAAALERLTEVPGGAVVEHVAVGGELSVRTQGAGGVEAAVRIIAETPELGGEYRVHAPESDGLFWVAIRAGSPAPDVADAATRSGLSMRERIPSIDRTIVSLTGDEPELTVYLRDSSAESVAAARGTLEEVAASGVFGEVRLAADGIDFDDQVVPAP
ncbi:hypothetical protein [Leucobacter chromiiresistens]|uniref:hypothetical protein n=1 Tax=Leucobacter chromiiresistens TaxID=1079994 RepID=UPI000262A52F|nr:hypothetical protein [Leucobacter chromiiresistens]